MLIMFIMLNIIVLLFILQLKVWSFNCHHLISPPPTSTLHLWKKQVWSHFLGVSFFAVVGCFWNTVDLQHYVPITQHSVLIFLYMSNWSQHLVIMHHHTKILHSYWLHSLYCNFHTHDSFVLKLEVGTS